MSISTDRLFAVTQASGATSPRQPHTLSQADLTARNRRAIGVAHSYAYLSLYRYRRPHPANDAAGAVALLCAAESWRAGTNGLLGRDAARGRADASAGDEHARCDHRERRLPSRALPLIARCPARFARPHPCSASDPGGRSSGPPCPLIASDTGGRSRGPPCTLMRGMYLETRWPKRSTPVGVRAFRCATAQSETATGACDHAGRRAGPCVLPSRASAIAHGARNSVEFGNRIRLRSNALARKLSRSAERCGRLPLYRAVIRVQGLG